MSQKQKYTKAGISDILDMITFPYVGKFLQPSWGLYVVGVSTELATTIKQHIESTFDIKIPFNILKMTKNQLIDLIYENVNNITLPLTNGDQPCLWTHRQVYNIITRRISNVLKRYVFTNELVGKMLYEVDKDNSTKKALINQLRKLESLFKIKIYGCYTLDDVASLAEYSLINQGKMVLVDPKNVDEILWKVIINFIPYNAFMRDIQLHLSAHINRNEFVNTKSFDELKNILLNKQNGIEK